MSLKQITEAEIKLPAIYIRPPVIYNINTLEFIGNCQKDSGKKEFKNVKIIDADGKSIRVIARGEIRPLNSIWKALLSGRKRIYKVNLEFYKEDTEMSFEQIRELLGGIIMRGASYWSSAGQLEEIVDEIQRAGSIKSLREAIDRLNGESP